MAIVTSLIALQVYKKIHIQGVYSAIRRTFKPGLRYIRGSLNKFPDFFRMGTFIDSTHMKL